MTKCAVCGLRLEGRFCGACGARADELPPEATAAVQSMVIGRSDRSTDLVYVHRGAIPEGGVRRGGEGTSP